MDDLDSKMESMRAQFEREAELETAWTSYNPSLARPLLNTKKFLEKGLANSRIVETPKAAAATAITNSVNDPGEEPLEPKPDLETPEPAVVAAEEPPPSSPLEALQRKFESHKVTPVTTKTI
jgi:hypothetical protein